MGVGYNPKIVTNGLILAYDEGNTKSQTSSELIAQRTATVVSSSSRSFAIDSTLATTYAAQAQYNSSASGTGFSFSTWIRRTGTTTGTWDQVIGIDSGGPRYRMLWFGYVSNATDQLHVSMPFYSANDLTDWYSLDPTWANAGVTFSINTWYNVSASYNNSNRALSVYINGRLAASGTRPGAGDLNNPIGAPIQLFGCNGVSSSNSQLRSAFFYNRALSAEETQQNYNALKERFGV